MESQTSQQLEEQAPKIQNGWMIGLTLFPTKFHLEAQKFRHVSELQLKLSQKLAATEALGSLGLRFEDFEIEGWPQKSALKPQNPQIGLSMACCYQLT